MAEQEQSPQSPDEVYRARRHLIIKGAIAVIAVVALIVALVVVEGPTTPEPAPTAHTVTSTGVTPEPSEQSPSLAEANTQALRNSSEAAEIQSAVMAEQQREESSAASAPVVPEESTEPLGVPAQPAAPAAPGTHRQGRLVLEQSPPKSPHVVASSSSVSVAPKAVVPPAPAKPVAAASSSAVGDFFVQVGVFANPANAEELRAKLTAAGIPTQVETRVQVGPFKDRKEAAAAQARLKSLGMDSGMVVTGRH